MLMRRNFGSPISSVIGPGSGATARVGQWSAFLPRGLRGLTDHIDSIAIRRGRPGTLLIIRAIK
jgi:hypothetical protein